MQLEDYFDFLAPDDIRIKGHRIGIETVLDEYLCQDRRPEDIVLSYPSLSLEEVYATILYYLRNRDAIDHYLADWHEFSRTAREQQRSNLSPWLANLRTRRAAVEVNGQPV